MPTKPPSSSTKRSGSSSPTRSRLTTPTLTMSWLAWTPTAAREAKESLDDQMRGAQMQPWIHGWEVQWTTWQDHAAYGVVIWCEPSPL